MSRFQRYALITIGTLCVVLGAIGIVLPLLPTTPFLVLAAALYARSSQRFYDWLMSRKHLGEYIRAYQEGRGMSAGAKALSISLLWLTLGSSAVFAIDALGVRLLLAAVGLGVTTHLLWIPTYGRIGLLEATRAELSKRRYTLPLDGRAALEVQHVGGKAASLSWLSHEGYQVPRGFVITPAALRKHLRSAGHDLDAPDVPATDDLVQRMMDSPLPRPVEREILRRYHELEGKVAVRSSAICEDGDWASCAGLLRTDLDVQGDQALLAAVKRCWASLFYESVRVYLCARGEGPESDRTTPTMGVVVQQMVPAVVAGVAFTADPVTGAGHMVIEAARGLGTGVVGGQQTPSQYIVQRGGAVTQAPPSHASCLPDAALAVLPALLWSVEAKRGVPQDIEWAWDGEEVWLLQARPITTLQDKSVYTSRPTAEMSPGIIKPLVWSVNTCRVPATFDRAFVLLTGRSEPDCHRMITLLHSRLYLDIKVFNNLIEKLGIPSSIMRGRLYGHAPSQERRRRLPLGLGLLRGLPRTARFMWRTTRARPHIESFLLAHEAALKPLRGADLTAYAPSALLKATDDLMLAHADAQWYTKIAALNLMLRNALLTRMARRCAPALDPADLLAGMGRERSLQSGIRLRAMSQIASGLDRPDRQAMLTGSDPEIRAVLSRSETGLKLLAEIESYLDEFGFLNSNGTDFSRTPWIEQPTVIWRAIVRGIQQPFGQGQPDPAKRRQEAEESLLHRRGRIARALLRRELQSTRDFLALKERCSLLMSEDSYHMHRIATQLGRHLHQVACIQEPDDVYCLFLDEIRELFSGSMCPEHAKSIAALRREQLEADALLEPPEVIYDEWHPPTLTPPVTAQSELRGVGASPGEAQGCARVVLDPSAIPMHLSPSDIIVVPFIDVGWMPLFSGISGIVTECGGQLSHGAILAREFGLPAVLAVERATRLIREGQTIGIDGALGVIRLLPN